MAHSTALDHLPRLEFQPVRAPQPHAPGSDTGLSGLGHISRFISGKFVAVSVVAALGSSGIYYFLRRRKQRTRKPALADASGAATTSMKNFHDRRVILRKALKSDVHHFFNIATLRSVFERFRAKGGDARQGLNFGAFSTAFRELGVEDEQILRSMFDSFDANRSGTVEFPELVSSLAIIAGGTREEKLRMIFKAYDLDHDGFLTVEELTKIFVGFHYANYETPRSPEDVMAAIAEPDVPALAAEARRLISLANQQERRALLDTSPAGAAARQAALGVRDDVCTEDQWVRLAYLDTIDLNTLLTKHILEEFGAISAE